MLYPPPSTPGHDSVPLLLPEVSLPSAKPHLNRGQWLVLAAAFLGWMFDGMEMGLSPIAARSALIDLMHLGSHGAALEPAAEAIVGQWHSYVVALFLVGAACGGVLFGSLGDRIGRVRAMALSILTYSLFTGCCYFAQPPGNWGCCYFWPLWAWAGSGRWAWPWWSNVCPTGCGRFWPARWARSATSVTW